MWKYVPCVGCGEDLRQIEAYGKLHSCTHCRIHKPAEGEVCIKCKGTRYLKQLAVCRDCRARGIPDLVPLGHEPTVEEIEKRKVIEHVEVVLPKAAMAMPVAVTTTTTSTGTSSTILRPAVKIVEHVDTVTTTPSVSATVTPVKKAERRRGRFQKVKKKQS